MNPSHLEEVDRTLLLISPARERAERSARAIRREDAGSRLPLRRPTAACSLSNGELMRSSYLGETSEQLKLAG